MPYTSFEKFTFGSEVAGPGIFLTTDPRDAMQRMVFHVGDRMCLVDLENWQAWELERLSRPLLFRRDLRIEPDLSSAFDPQLHYTANGTIAVGGGERSIWLQFHGQGMWTQGRVVIDGPDTSTIAAEVAFSRWALVTGTDQTYEIVREFDVGRPGQPVH